MPRRIGQYFMTALQSLPAKIICKTAFAFEQAIKRRARNAELKGHFFRRQFEIVQVFAEMTANRSEKARLDRLNGLLRHRGIDRGRGELQGCRKNRFRIRRGDLTRPAVHREKVIPQQRDHSLCAVQDMHVQFVGRTQHGGQQSSGNDKVQELAAGSCRGKRLRRVHDKQVARPRAHIGALIALAALSVEIELQHIFILAVTADFRLRAIVSLRARLDHPDQDIPAQIAVHPGVKTRFRRIGVLRVENDVDRFAPRPELLVGGQQGRVKTRMRQFAGVGFGIHRVNLLSVWVELHIGGCYCPHGLREPERNASIVQQYFSGVKFADAARPDSIGQ
ncbi:protein of unknown function [Burkholderia multivorans]